MYYFAYGSNMSSARLQRRIERVQKVMVASLPGYRLVFNKRGMDGSGKCHVQQTGQQHDRVYGVIYDICEYSRSRLDEYEGVGRGYETMSVNLLTSDQSQVEAFTYYATDLDEQLRPFHWYKQHVLIGAREQELPEDYVQIIESIESIEDRNGFRVQTELAIHGDSRFHIDS